MMKLSVVVPAYNEAQRLPPSLDTAIAYLRENHPGFELIVVDDGSSDSTAEVVRSAARDEPAVQLVSYTPNRGKGYAVRTGLRAATGDLILFSDADLSTPIEEVSKLIAAVESGADVAIGSRALAQSEIRERQPLYRELGGKLFNLVVRLFLLPDLHDTQCGFKLFRRDAIQPLLDHLANDGFAFDVEILALARAAGLRIAEVPVIWVNSPMTRVRMSAALRAYSDLMAIRRRAKRLTLARPNRSAIQP